MKFTAEVVAALEVLRAAAENDFERHRLDVLERDLHEPPKFEQIDENHQIFNGVVFVKRADHKDSTEGHYYRQTGIHRDIWQYYHGEIPEGYSIHHIDENKGNNAIENLQCLPAEEHSRLHCSKGKPVAKSVTRKFVCEFCGQEYKAVDVGLNRYCSVKCREAAHKQRRTVERACIICGKTFWQSRDHRAKTCSSKCAQVLRAQTLKNQSANNDEK